MMIQVQHLSKTYYQNQIAIPVLKNLHFEVPSSQTLSIIGHSGCGKTTLLSLLAGLEQPDSGSIFVNKKNITQMTEKELISYRANQVGIVFQQFHLIPHLTALENVALPLEINQQSNITHKAKEQIEQVRLSHRMHHFPHQLSGGEKQRIAIARALVHQPSILLADEPTGNLDQASAKTISDLLFSLVKKNKTTLVLVTHNTLLATQCDQQIHLNQENNLT